MRTEKFLAAEATPRWIKDVFRFLPVKSQFVLSGNVRDRYPFPVAEAGAHLPLTLDRYLAEALRLRGYRHFITLDPVDGFTPLAPRGEADAAAREFFAREFKMTFDVKGRMPCSLDRGLDLAGEMAAFREAFIVIFFDLASRYVVRMENLSDREHEFFTRALKLSHTINPHTTTKLAEALFNPVFWICDQENDLPAWFLLDNPRVRQTPVPKPDHVLRRAMIEAVMPSLPEFMTAASEEQLDKRDRFVDQTEGLALTDVIAITQLCRRESLSFRDIGEAVRRYKLGVTEDPWRRIDRAKIAQGREFITNRVKGQDRAVVKALDIIKRAMTGLSGSQAGHAGGRPRGVMFLAGPTGVGKTELAKTLTELLFGDERAYIRFDMSEFSAEHADQRLLGAPPGYIGYSSGGELTNAIREKPFSVVLFDEIEKAHPRILDKFLQLLDDGVLTSGRGERVYFSEAVIIFTSNLGIYHLDAMGHRTANVTPEDAYDDLEAKIRGEIESYFKTALNRPEILNRIGENIVIFDFIRPPVARQIFDRMVSNILQRLADERRIYVGIRSEAVAALQGRCLADLSHGGRGVGNQLEAWLINPLARALFDQEVPSGARLKVARIEEENGVPSVKLEAAAS
jgi:ATP-dependent Clp protease ATP-binding subunit ClpA